MVTHTKRNIHLIERVERRATKLIFKSDSNYESRLKELNLVSLEQRRFIADVIFLYKVLNGYFNVDLSSFLIVIVQTIVIPFGVLTA